MEINEKALQVAIAWYWRAGAISENIPRGCIREYLANLPKAASKQPVRESGWQKGEAPKDTGVQYLLACADVWVCPAEWTGEDWHIHNITIFPNSDFLKDKPTHWMYLPYPELTKPTSIEVEKP